MTNSFLKMYRRPSFLQKKILISHHKYTYYNTINLGYTKLPIKKFKLSKNLSLKKKPKIKSQKMYFI